jgi:hypothetical protein
MPHDVASWKVRYAPIRISPKCARLITRSTPHVTERPMAIRA